MSIDQWLERVLAINQWTRDGVRAPHKPLLLLIAIGRLASTGSSEVSFAEIEEPLRRLLVEYGPPGTGGTPRYPFRRLENDGLWQVRFTGADPGERVVELRERATGRLAPEFEAVLVDPVHRAVITQAILDEHFPPSLHDDLLAEVGIEAGALVGPTGVPAGHTRARRDPRFRDLVLVAYERRCAFCGFDGQVGAVTIGLDAAHVRWHAFDGPDDVSNGMALCTLHHKLFDRGAMGLGSDGTIAVSQEFVGRGETAERLVLALVGDELRGPQTGADPPASEHVAWHTSQVFRGPSRVAV